MNYAKRERETLGFIPYSGRGSVEETFYPWDLTVERFKKDGLSESIADNALYFTSLHTNSFDELKNLYFTTNGSYGVKNYEQDMNFDPLIRLSFHLPFARKCPKIIEDNSTYTILQNELGTT
ncbi:MAG: hypothetical protein RR683_09205, partial [Lachnospiraceae bacterium]